MAMASTPSQHPAIHRLNKAYVQVPISPNNLSSYRSLGTPTHVAASSSKLKENTPLRPLSFAMTQATSSASLKRKLADRDPGSTVAETTILNTKKAKTIDPNPAQPKMNQVKDASEAPKTNTEFPNGYVYCHQCNKKRDVSATVRCMFIEYYRTAKDKPRERQCISKYCGSCLKNRYNEDIKVLKAQVVNQNSASNQFKCPRCRDICNCSRCRKSKGLEATGLLNQGKAEPPSEGEKKSKARDINTAENKEPVQVQCKKPLPIVKWTAVPVNISQAEGEERIFIREFMLRFSSLMEPVISKTNLEELGLIGGKSRGSEGEDETTGWVNEGCIKAMVLGLLGLLSGDHDTQVAQAIRGAIKVLRSGGVSLNKTWASLDALRDTIVNLSSVSSAPSSESPDGFVPLTFPDPSPPPVSLTMHVTRSLRSVAASAGLVNVIQSVQMIPVIISLIHSALETAALREEIDQGIKNAKDTTRDAREATRQENERWENIKKSMEATVKDPKDKAVKAETKIKRTAHKDQILNIENALKIVSSSFGTRFVPLGVDNEARTYYALSPGIVERAAAFESLETGPSENVIKSKKGRIVSPEDRNALREWSWFIAVWGKRPPREADGVPGPSNRMDVDGASDASDDEDDDVDEEKWWGFCEADEISKLGEWIAVGSGIEDDDCSESRNASASSERAMNIPTQGGNGRLKRLITELKDYASLLEWRTKCGAVAKSLETITSMKGKEEAIHRGDSSG